MIEPSGIYKKLHAIMAEAAYIQKDKQNQNQNYKYASEAAIKEKLHGLFVKHGVVPVFSATNQIVAEIAPTKAGSAQYRTTLDLAFRFIDIEDGSAVEGVMSGCGVDGADKGTYKAITGALKYILTSTFIIPTGDDPENEAGERDAPAKVKAAVGKKPDAPVPAKPAPQTPAPPLGQGRTISVSTDNGATLNLDQQKALHIYADSDLGLGRRDFKSWLCSQGYKGDDGEGTTKTILVADLPNIRRRLELFVRGEG